MYEKTKPSFTGAPVVYHIFGKEVCPTTQREHWQGYVCFACQIRHTQVCQAAGGPWHFVVARGTVDDNVKYCSKDGVVEEYGKRPLDPSAYGRERIRDSWSDAYRRAQLGQFDAISRKLYIQNHRALRAIHQESSGLGVRNLTPDSKPGLRLAGPPGVGKSHHARLLGSPLGIYNKNHTKWWDGYRGEDCVLIDDVDKTHRWMSGYIKNWVDLYSFEARRKVAPLASVRYLPSSPPTT